MTRQPITAKRQLNKEYDNADKQTKRSSCFVPQPQAVTIINGTTNNGLGNIVGKTHFAVWYQRTLKTIATLNPKPAKHKH